MGVRIHLLIQNYRFPYPKTNPEETIEKARFSQFCSSTSQIFAVFYLLFGFCDSKFCSSPTQDTGNTKAFEQFYGATFIRAMGLDITRW